MPNKLIWPLLIILLAGMAGITAWLGPASPFRAVVLSLFMLIAPGLAFTRLFSFRDLLAEIVLAIATSLVIGTLLAEFMVFTHAWSPNAGLAVLILLSLVGSSLQIRNYVHQPVRRDSE